MLAECSLAFILSCAILDVRTSSPSSELLAGADCMLRDPWDSTPLAKPMQEKIDLHIENIQTITRVFGREIAINVISTSCIPFLSIMFQPREFMDMFSDTHRCAEFSFAPNIYPSVLEAC